VRIVHAADSFSPDIGGIESQVEALALKQQADGHDVTVITAVHDPAPELPLDVVRASAGRWLTVAFPWRDHKTFDAVLDAGPIDVVHVHLTVISPVGIYVLRAASRRRIPVAITVHSVWWKVGIATRVCLLPFGWGRIRAVWSGVSNETARHVARTLPRVRKVSVVPNLVDTGWWAADDEEGDRLAPSERDEYRIVLVGRLKRRKHIGPFLDLLARTRDRLPAGARFRVDIVGEGPRRADLEEQIARLGLGEHVHLLGHRDPVQIRELLHGSDLFVAPSQKESFGIAALEARAAGLPVLGYRATGLADFITDGVDGRLAEDDEDLVRVLVELLTVPGVLDKLRSTAASVPPPVDPGVAMAAVYALYERARREL
jgi:glycosyltransferase involved in cell wall biosynthesis